MRERDFISHDRATLLTGKTPSKSEIKALPVAAMVYEIRGALSTYSVDAVDGGISFVLNGCNLTVKADQVEPLVEELNRVLSTMKQMDMALINMGCG